MLPAAVLVLAFASTACGDGGSERDATATAPLPVDGKAFPIDPGEFTTAIDNPYWPMKPGRGASIISTDALAKVPYGHFEHGVQTRNFSGIEPDVIEEKIYAQGVGVVLEITVSGGSDRDELLSYTEG